MIPFTEIYEKALELGWQDVAVTAARIPEPDIASYQEWLTAGFQGDLKYMENQMRCDPEQWLPGAKSAIVFVSYYKQERLPFLENRKLIASYARGRDYHHLHKKRLKRFICWLEERGGTARGFSDSSPVLEKALAAQAGLGWFGKNSLLIHRRFGTFFLLAGLFTTLELEGELQETRIPRCGSCNRCLEACPTQAIVSPYKLDATKCLSYHLIESKGPVVSEIAARNPGYAFGCDICQDVCPHNVRTPLATEPTFAPSAGMGAYLDLAKLEAMAPEQLYGTPLQRRGVQGLKWNLIY